MRQRKGNGKQEAGVLVYFGWWGKTRAEAWKKWENKPCQHLGEEWSRQCKQQVQRPWGGGKLDVFEKMQEAEWLNVARKDGEEKTLEKGRCRAYRVLSPPRLGAENFSLQLNAQDSFPDSPPSNVTPMWIHVGQQGAHAGVFKRTTVLF